MKKLALVLTVFTASVFGVKAQSSGSQGEFTFGVGINAALPVGDYHTFYSFGVGLQLQGEYAFTDQIKGVGTTGYTQYIAKDLGGGVKANSVGHIPILAGARFYPQSSFFVGAQIGFGLFTNTGGGSSSGFEYKPQVGYDAGSVQIIGGYDGVSLTGATFSTISVSAIFKIGGKK